MSILFFCALELHPCSYETLIHMLILMFFAFISITIGFLAIGSFVWYHERSIKFLTFVGIVGMLGFLILRREENTKDIICSIDYTLQEISRISYGQQSLFHNQTNITLLISYKNENPVLIERSPINGFCVKKIKCQAEMYEKVIVAFFGMIYSSCLYIVTVLFKTKNYVVTRKQTNKRKSPPKETNDKFNETKNNNAKEGLSPITLV